ncbi:MAG TPA: Nif3-like dinuclear metal center hexameric protein [Bacteroidales bacterium]|nr:Nif3-like dinuclear metal center hexameric protein [Bacteroidales bacterium]
MKLKEIVSFFEQTASFSFQESYDNSGLQTGNPGADVSGALITLDVTEEVVDEAVREGLNLIISHHPVIFGQLKGLTGKNATERILLKAIKGDIAILSVHTNIDSVEHGVNGRICDKLGLVDRKVLAPAEGKLLKLVFFVPADHASRVREAIFHAGAGVIGDYDQCSFNVDGTGTFRASENASPYVGEKGQLHFEKEVRVETVLPSHIKNRVIAALLDNHPYEEVAWDLYTLENSWPQVGMGMTGRFEEAMEEHDFLNAVKAVFNAGCVRYTRLTGKTVQHVAVCGGSGSFLLENAISAGADAFITADFKYHQFFEADGRILVADIGHYESEQFTKELFYELVTKNFPKFAVRLSEVITNPINYI